MKQSTGKGRINALNIVNVELEAGISDELAMTATVGLLDSTKGPNLLGSSLYKGPWPTEVLELVNKLRSEMESHLLSVYFEVTDDSTRASPNKPTSIIEPKLGTTITETPQL